MIAILSSTTPWKKRRYTVKTYDNEKGQWTGQRGTKVSPYKITLRQLRRHLRELQGMGYPCNRIKDSDSDPSVLIERVL